MTVEPPVFACSAGGSGSLPEVTQPPRPLDWVPSLRVAQIDEADLELCWLLVENRRATKS